MGVVRATVIRSGRNSLQPRFSASSHASSGSRPAREPRDAAAALAPKWDYPGTRGREHLDPGIAGIRRDSVGFGPQSGTESGTKWDKVGLKWDSEGLAPALFDRGSEGADADGCSRQDGERPLILSSPVVARMLLHVMERSSHGRRPLCTAPCSGESSGSGATSSRPLPVGHRERSYAPTSTIATTGPPPCGPWCIASTETNTAGSPMAAAATPPTAPLEWR